MSILILAGQGVRVTKLCLFSFGLLLPAVLLINSTATAQGRINHLYFGSEFITAADFRGGDVEFSEVNIRGQQALNHWEHNGEVQFLLVLPQPSERPAILDKQSEVMPGSRELKAHGSTSESGICPVPGTTDQFYVFHQTAVDQDDRVHDIKLYYSIVDLGLRGGLGDMHSVNTLIDSDDNQSEGMEIVAVLSPCDDERVAWYWLLRYKHETGLVGRRIDREGIHDEELLLAWDAPASFSGRGELEYHNGMVGVAFESSGSALLCEFDAWNATVTNPFEIEFFEERQDGGPYGLEFSPDGNQLYVSRWRNFTTNLFQYSINTSAKRQFDFDNYASQIEQGPDGRLYMSSNVRIVVIDNPNSPFSELREIDMRRNGRFRIAEGISDPVQYFTPGSGVQLPELVVTGATQICACNGSTTLFAPEGFESYRWTPGDATTASIIVDEPGDYKLEVVDDWGCKRKSQTISVEEIREHQVLVGDTLRVDPGGSAFLTLRIVSSGLADDCDPRPFRMRIAFPAAGAELLSLERGSSIEEDKVENGLRLVTISGEARLEIERLELRGLAAEEHIIPVIVEEFEWIDCSQTVELRQSAFLVVTPAIAVSGASVVCQCSENPTLLEGPPGFDGYEWQPGNRSGRSIEVDEAGIYTLVVTDALGFRHTSADFSVTNLNDIGVLALPELTVKRGARFEIPMILTPPAGAEPCDVMAFNATIAFANDVLSFERFRGDVNLQTDITKDGVRNISFNAVGSDTLARVVFQARDPESDSSLLRVAAFSLDDCELAPSGMQDGIVRLDGTVDVKLTDSPPPLQLKLAGRHPYFADIGFTLDVPLGGPVKLRLLSALGADVVAPRLLNLAAGRHRLKLDGDHLAAGVYLLLAESKDGNASMNVVRR